MDRCNFTWSNFQDNMQDYIKSIRQDQNLFDVTLVSEDNQVIKAHKFVLSAGSPFFKNILQIPSHPHPLIYIKGVQMKQLSSVLDFVYIGEVSIDQEDIEKFFAAAEDFQIKGLVRENVDPFYNEIKESDDSDADTIIYSQISKTSSSLIQCYEDMSASKIENSSANDKTQAYVSMEHIYDSVKNKDNADQELIVLTDGLWHCKLCDKADKKKSAMKCHLQVHSASDPYSCSFCGKSFKNKGALKMHKYKMHTSDKLLQRSLIAMT